MGRSWARLGGENSRSKCFRGRRQANGCFRHCRGEGFCAGGMVARQTAPGCTQCVRTEKGSAQMKRARAEAPRTGVYVISAWNFQRTGRTGCNRAQGSVFADESLCKKLGMKRKMSTAYHSQTDGQTERVNQVLGGYLRIFVNYDQNDWYHLLPLAKIAYNNSATSAHGMTPFFVNYGYHPQTEWLKEREAQNPGADMDGHWMKMIHQKARESLEKTREAMGRYYNQHARQQPDFKVGDLVMLNAKNIHTKRPSPQLAPRLYGPFKILEQ